MAAIVKANPSLTAGGLAVLKREYSTTDDGICTYTAEYCCLAKFANNHVGRFRTGAQPPTPLPASMSILRLESVPKMYDVSVRTQNGLTFFSASYSAASVDAGEVTTTESSEQRSFSGSFEASVNVPGGNNNTDLTLTGTSNVSFDYISVTVRVEAKNPQMTRFASGRVGQPFNVNIGKIYTKQPLLVGKWEPSTIETESVSKSTRGTYTYSKSSTGIYQAKAELAFY